MQNLSIIAMDYVQQHIKVNVITLEVQANYPFELLSVMLGENVIFETNTKKKLTQTLQLYESSSVLKSAIRYNELKKELEYTIELITPDSYPLAENNKRYLNDNILKNLNSGYGGNWLMLFNIIQETTRNTYNSLNYYDFDYKFISDPVETEIYISLMIDNVIGFAALNKKHVVAVLNRNSKWKIIDISRPEKNDILYKNLISVFKELKKRHLDDFCIVCYTVNDSINKTEEDETTPKGKLDSPRKKRVRDERRSREQYLLVL